MRNAAKDAIEMERKRRAFLDSAFRLFSERSIDSITLTEVASGAGICIASLYRYFPNKRSLVAAVGADRWSSCHSALDAICPPGHEKTLPAAVQMVHAADLLIRFYENHQAFLCFCSDFHFYVLHQNIPADEIRGYLDSVQFIHDRFHCIYQAALKDGTIRTDLPENELFSATLYSILNLSALYAQPVSGFPVDGFSRVNALKNQKEMVLRFSLTEAGWKELNSH